MAGRSSTTSIFPPGHFTSTRSAFTLVPSPNRNDQVAEVLTIIVTPEPFGDLPLSNNPIKISKGDVAKWERSWSTQVERFEMVGGAGMSWTESEKEASSSSSARLLTQEEPPPQTIYRIGSRNKKSFPGHRTSALQPIVRKEAAAGGRRRRR